MTNDINTSIPKGERLGEILISRSILKRRQLEEALKVQRTRKAFLGEILVEMGMVMERDIVIALVVQCHIPYIAVDKYGVDLNVIQMVPAEIAYKYCIIPLDKVGQVLSVVMQNPLDIYVRRELRKITNCQIFPFIATRSEIHRALTRWYSQE